MQPLALAGGYLADLAFGDPRHRHPVAAFGRMAAAAETRWHRDSRMRGVMVTSLLVGSAGAVGRAIGGLGPVGSAALVWAALGGRSLRLEAHRIDQLLHDEMIEEARVALSSLCGRDPQELDGAELAAAVVESLAENTSDAVVAPLLWGGITGPAGVALYRAANTLDAMFGHRSPRLAKFGWAAARFDDAVNWVPARVTAMLACLLAPLVGGSARRGWERMRADGPLHPSPNAGRVEAAFAGVLDLSLGGPLAYAGRVQRRPVLGTGPRPGPEDIARAARLSSLVCTCSLILSCAAAAAGAKLR